MEKEISEMGSGDQFRGVVSHLKKGQLTRRLQRAVQRGVTVELLVHDTERRVPAELVDKLRRSGVRITRVIHPEGLPMHAKFLLISRDGKLATWLGSHNFNAKSQTRNAEVLLRTADASVTAALSRRYEEIAAMT